MLDTYIPVYTHKNGIGAETFEQPFAHTLDDACKWIFDNADIAENCGIELAYVIHVQDRNGELLTSPISAAEMTDHYDDWYRRWDWGEVA